MSPDSDWLKSLKKWDLVLKAGRVGSDMCCRAKPAWDLIFAGDQPKSSLRSALPLSSTLFLCLRHTLLLTVLWSCYILPWLCPCFSLCIECPYLFFLTIPVSASCITWYCNYLLTCLLSSREETMLLFTAVSSVSGTEQFSTRLVEPMIKWAAITLRVNNHFSFISLCCPTPPQSTPIPRAPVRSGKGLKG